MTFHKASLELAKVSIRRVAYLLFLRWRFYRIAACLFCAMVVLHLSRQLYSSSRPLVIETIENISPTNEQIYIASLHWNDDALIREHWTPAILDLVQHLGADNVYVSVIESGSWDGTKDALTDLDLKLGELGVERNIELRTSTHEDEIKRTPAPGEKGWIWTSRGRKELRRIPYLAGLRNQAMERLWEVSERTDGRKQRRFDKVLWLNDVIFTVWPHIFCLSSEMWLLTDLCLRLKTS